MSIEEWPASSGGGERLVIWTRALGDAEATRAFGDAAASRFRAAGGELLGQIGGTTIAAFEPLDAIEACQLVLDLLSETPASMETAASAALGEVSHPHQGAVRGDVLDRAQWFCHRAGHGELVLDDGARALVAGHFLFAPPLGEEAGQRRAHPIDRMAPTIAECRAAVARLARPPLPASHGALAEAVAAHTRATGRSVLLVRASATALLDSTLEHVARTASPGRVLTMGPVPFGLEPLGSLRYGLTRLFPLARELDEACAPLDEPLHKALADVRLGRPVPRSLVSRALSAFLAAAPSKPWIVVDPLPAIDASTARVLKDLAESGPDLLVVARIPPEGTAPEGAFGEARVELLEVSGLGGEGPRFAASILGVPDEHELAAFVASVGGNTPLGVLEAARTLVSRGDVVFGDDGFRPRQRVRPRRSSVPLQRLIAERLRDLETNAFRMLEVVALCPPGTPRPVLDRALELDGLGEDARRAATRTLEREAWITGGLIALPSAEPIRAAVLKSMAPARRVELQTFLAKASADLAGGLFAKVAAATHARAAGETDGPAAILIDAADAARELEHRRAALKLAATAVEWSRSPEIRRRAAELARGDEGDHADGASMSHAASERLAARWIEALKASDLELADRLIDEGIAEGAPLVTAETLRSWMALLRGDLGLARELLASTHDDGKSAPPQLDLVAAFVELHEARPRDAMARALRVLATARRGADKGAEAAALATIALCFDAIGREDDARALRQLAVDAAMAARTLRSKNA